MSFKRRKPRGRKQKENEFVSFIKQNWPILTVVAIGAAWLLWKKLVNSNNTTSRRQSTNNTPKIAEKANDDDDDECKECKNDAHVTNGGDNVVNNILYGTPMDAFKNGKREKLLYTTATRTGQSNSSSGDFIAVVDVNPDSSTYCKIIHSVKLGENEEVHHSGWNACASCYGMTGMNRKYLVVPAFTSGNIHFIDVHSDPIKLKLYKTISGKMIANKYGLSYPHTPHCLASGQVCVSYLNADPNHNDNFNNNGLDFLLINENIEVDPKKPRYIADKADRPVFGYDYWYQPYHNIMVSTGWGAADAFTTGFNPQHLNENKYSSSIHFWDWDKGKKIKTITFEKNQVSMPLEIKFCHNPKSVHAVIGCALTSNIIHVYKDSNTNEWCANPDYIRVKGIEMSNWKLPVMPGLTTDVIMSMDDKYIYFSNWLHGDIRQYDISDIFNPKLNDQIWIGGCLRKDCEYNIKDPNKNKIPIIPKIKGIRLRGGPQMLQLSLDGKRLYVTNSLYTAYDKQFYPDLLKNGGHILRIDIDLDNNGKMSLNKDFIVDFGNIKGGPARPHEMRYPGGDCTSDIFLVQD